MKIFIILEANSDEYDRYFSNAEKNYSTILLNVLTNTMHKDENTGSNIYKE